MQIIIVINDKNMILLILNLLRFVLLRKFNPIQIIRTHIYMFSYYR